MAIPTNRSLVARPAKDEWGVYDPQQAGLAALFARLDTKDARPAPALATVPAAKPAPVSAVKPAPKPAVKPAEKTGVVPFRPTARDTK
jgi:hypothetical protein